MNPLTITLLITAGVFGYIFGGISIWNFLKHVRKWPSSSLADEGIWASIGWPLTVNWFFCFFVFVAVKWIVLLPFRPLKVRAARIKRSGKNYRGEIVK